MSSPRPVPPPCAGVLELQNRAVGPIRLPDRGAADFLKRFNEVYLEIGLQIAPNPALVMAPSSSPAAAVSVVAVGSTVAAPSIAVMPLTQQRNSFIDHLTSALNDVVYGQTCQEPNLTGAQPSCLIELLRRASVEQAGKVIQGVSAATHLRSITAIMQVAARRIRGDHQAAESITAEAITELDAGQWQQLQHQFLTTHRSLSESIKALDTQRDECVGAAVDVLASLAYQAGMIMQKLRQV